MIKEENHAIVSDVISLLISVVEIKYDHSFSEVDQKELVGIKIKMKLHVLTFLFRYKTASATGLGIREIFQLAQ